MGLVKSLLTHELRIIMEIDDADLKTYHLFVTCPMCGTKGYLLKGIKWWICEHCSIKLKVDWYFYETMMYFPDGTHVDVVMEPSFSLFDKEK
jgi:hypothetical protein